MYISYNDEVWHEYYLFEPLREQYVTHMVSIPLAPGKTVSHEKWVLLFRRRSDDGSFAANYECPFEKPGRYRINIKPDVEGAAEFVVVDQPDEGKELFKTGAVEMFLGEIIVPPEHIQMCEKLMKEHPSSFYAPYAAMALWKWEKNLFENPYLPGDSPRSRFKSREDLMEGTMHYLDFIIEKSSPGAIHEEALKYKAEYFLSEATKCYPEMGKDAAKEAYKKWKAELQKQYPDSLSLKEVEKQEKKWKRDLDLPELPPPKPVAKREGGCVAQIEALHKIPPGAREAFESFWKAYAAEQVDVALAILSDDFHWADGNRATVQEAMTQWKAEGNTEEVVVTVDEANICSFYDMPAGGKKTKRHEGKFCVVKGGARIVGRLLETGQKVEYVHPQVTWVLAERAGEWKLVFLQDAPPRPSSSEAMDKVQAELRGDGFKRWRISDGKSERFPLEEVLDKLELGEGLGVSDVECKWVGTHVLDSGWRAKFFVVIWRKQDSMIEDARGRGVEIIVGLTDDEKQCLLEEVKIGGWTTIPEYR